MPTRRIGINAVFFNPDRSGGAETYLGQLIRHLQQLEGDERFVVFAGKTFGLELDNDRFELVTCPVDPSQVKRRIFFEQRVLWKEMNRRGLDLAHFPYSSLPRRYTGKAVVTLHDVTRATKPKTLSLLERQYKKLMETDIASKGRHVIFPSQAGVDVLVDKVGIQRDNITVIHHGVDSSFLDSEPTGNARSESTRSGLLWVGGPYPTKNVPTLLKALAVIRDRIADGSLTGFELPSLTLQGGRDASGQASYEAEAQALGIADHVTHAAAIPHAALADVYRRHALFCYPSTLESFGIPVLEAMACGTPVVCSDLPVFHEVCGSAVRFADPQSPDSFADAMIELLTDHKLRASLADASREQAAKFTWRRTAEQTLACYRRLLAK